jgi:hypothetical protein
MNLKDFQMGGGSNWGDTPAKTSDAKTSEDVLSDIVESSLLDPAGANEARWNSELLEHGELFEDRGARMEARQEIAARLFGEGGPWEGMARVSRKGSGSKAVVVGDATELVRRWVGEGRYSVTGIGGTLYVTTPAPVEELGPNPYKVVLRVRGHLKQAEARLHDLRGTKLELRERKQWSSESGHFEFDEGPTLQGVEWRATIEGEVYSYEGEGAEAYFESQLAEKVAEAEAELEALATSLREAEEAVVHYEFQTEEEEAAFYESLS